MRRSRNSLFFSFCSELQRKLSNKYSLTVTI
ncbi:unnamed protein product [Oikopleura dioica]|uniref:Uncharacterized protein n=1 Tax=Oikopleura dioica TaxID=34765 RepID=E4Y6P5_OIKDI|nr:unnamed protein product [Oikopleura dioica]